MFANKLYVLGGYDCMSGTSARVESADIHADGTLSTDVDVATLGPTGDYDAWHSAAPLSEGRSLFGFAAFWSTCALLKAAGAEVRCHGDVRTR